MKSIIILFSLFGLFSLSCNKDKDSPTLTITAPTNGALIGGPVQITGDVTDKELHEMTFRITRDSDGAELYSKSSEEMHELKSYHFNQTFTPAGITLATPVTLTVTVEDHSGHKTTGTVRFSLIP